MKCTINSTCSAEAAPGTLAPAGEQARADTPTQVLDTDIVIVGAGASGLCAAVQAGANGDKVLVLEVNRFVGGNGLMTEGMFACGSAMQQAEGISIHFKDLFAREAAFFNYRIDATFWKDLYDRSAENLQWLIDNGVPFSGVVDCYHAFGHIPGFHWFAGKRGYGFIKALHARAVEQGAEFLMGTRGRKLIMKDGAAAGIYATQEDGGCVEIRCRAVILASGGYAGNLDMLVQRGKNRSRIAYAGGPGHMGDGLNMAAAAGARDISQTCCFLCGVGTKGLAPLGDTILRFLTCESPAMWVNQDAVRFAREDCALETSGCQANAVETQRESYAIIDCNGLDAVERMTPGLKSTILAVVAAYKGTDIAVCDTIEACAAAMGLHADTLSATLRTYNAYCEAGDDRAFGKSPPYLVPLIRAPYYIFRHNITYMCSIGGIHTNTRMEVLNQAEQPIPGLYAIGADSCELYRETYTISIPASCNANNCNSGRTAANVAAAYLRGQRRGAVGRGLKHEKERYP